MFTHKRPLLTSTPNTVALHQTTNNNNNNNDSRRNTNNIKKKKKKKKHNASCLNQRRLMLADSTRGEGSSSRCSRCTGSAGQVIKK
ncbi:uncharacterized protein Dmoj_GI26941 [Drosophila mojavensis]|uniref:Uncharacterized protein n=1 Tax=Drosophila mojavensis TaxID=7230 RepID=A0A0Q9X7V2_DROMO|nr:uncharacterized protein Dmoj_GI26941 [Drosophila mojavensis]